MINRGKLIPRSTKSNTVKSNSVSDLYVIKGAAIKVDNILKERLVLSKVREGILRQEEERRIRSGREMLLEKDVKNNYNVEDTDKAQKKKSGLGGLLGTVFKGILGSLGSVAFGLTPSLLGVGLVLKKLTNPFLLITGVALTALNVIVSKSGSQFKELNRKVSKDDVSAGKIERGVSEFRNSLLTAVGLYAAGSAVGVGARGLIGGRLFTKTEVEARTKAAENLKAEEIFKVREQRIRNIDVDKAADARIREAELDVETLNELDRTQGKGIIKGKNVVRSSEGQFLRGMPGPRKITKKIMGQQRPVAATAFKYDPNLTLLENEERLSKFKANLLSTKRIIKDANLGASANAAARRDQVILDIMDEIGFEDDPRMKEFDADELKRFDREMFAKGRKRNLISPTIRRKISGERLSIGRTFDRSMLRLGGKKLAKSTFSKGAKSIIRNSVNGIPLIGDLIALLLDVFVFGEPVGRAAFMAVGSIIGGIIGGVAGLLGGPVMAMIGGLVGSISGDLLGAAFYDLIFRKGNINVGDRFGNAITRGGFKAGVAGALSTGGFANFGRYLLGEEGREFVLDADSTAALENNYPGLLMALNKSDGAGAIELLKEYASYENEGRVSFVPIPIPSVSKPNETIVVLDPKGMVTSKRSYSEHYRRG